MRCDICFVNWLITAFLRPQLLFRVLIRCRKLWQGPLEQKKLQCAVSACSGPMCSDSLLHTLRPRNEHKFQTPFSSITGPHSQTSFHFHQAIPPWLHYNNENMPSWVSLLHPAKTVCASCRMVNKSAYVSEHTHLHACVHAAATCHSRCCPEHRWRLWDTCVARQGHSTSLAD